MIRIVIPAGIEELIPGYLAGREADIPVLRYALVHGDFERIRVLAHQLKGSGAAYGFAGLTVIGQQMERGARESFTDSVGEQIAALDHYLHHIEISDSASGLSEGASGVVK
jgi:HPt (histidine-containing phosphotransfer) domain-containing protein